MANKRITDLTDTTTYEENDVIMVDGTNGTRKISFKALLEKTKFSGLATTAKNIIGAINELNTKIGTGLNNANKNGFVTYPTTIGVHRVISWEVPGLPEMSLGYGTLLIANGGTYYMHLYIDASNTMYWTRTTSLTAPSYWEKATTTSVNAYS